MPPNRIKKPALPRCPRIQHEAVRDTVRTLLRNLQASSKRVACLECGSVSDLLRIGAFLYGSAETWEITLPVCERCASKESANAALGQAAQWHRERRAV